MGRKLVLAAAACCLWMTTDLPRAEGSAIAGALESTQVANMMELIQQTITEIEEAMTLANQLRMFQQQFETLGQGGWLQTAQTLVQIHEQVVDFHQLAFQGAATMEAFAEMHPGVVTPTDFVQQYNALRDANRSSVQNALQVMGLQENQVQNDWQLLNTLQNNITSAQSQRAAIDAGNHLLLEIVRQLQLMHQTMRAHYAMMATVEGTGNQRQSFQEAEQRSYFGTRGSVNIEPGRNWSENRF